MLRSLGFLIALALVTPGAANAQVFKPKSSAKKTDSKPAVKAAAKKTSTKKRPAKKKKTKVASKRPAPTDDEDTESAPKESDKDYVKITDDDEVE